MRCSVCLGSFTLRPEFVHLYWPNRARRGRQNCESAVSSAVTSGFGSNGRGIRAIRLRAARPWRPSQFLALPFAVQLAVEGPRPAAVEAALQRLREVFEREMGDVGQVEFARLAERSPDEIDKLRLRVHHAL